MTAIWTFKWKVHLRSAKHIAIFSNPCLGGCAFRGTQELREGIDLINPTTSPTVICSCPRTCLPPWGLNSSGVDATGGVTPSLPSIPSSASAASSNHDYHACTILNSIRNSIINPTQVNESRSEPQVAGRTGSDTICNTPPWLRTTTQTTSAIFFFVRPYVRA
jgi:hypothetical protein